MTQFSSGPGEELNKSFRGNKDRSLLEMVRSIARKVILLIRKRDSKSLPAAIVLFFVILITIQVSWTTTKVIITPTRPSPVILPTPRVPQKETIALNEPKNVMIETVEKTIPSIVTETEQIPPTAASPKVDKDKFEHIAIAVKTGADTATDRLPIQLLTFLSRISNLIIIGDSSGVEVGPFKVLNVIENLYNSSSSKKSKRSSDVVVPDTSSAGWKMDAHKNLPGYRELYNRFPDAEWFIMIDDDTYLFLDNLKSLLDRYNPDYPHYFGSSNMFVGCGGYTKLGEGPAFAHGGSGIVVSRGAMKRMMTKIESCIEQYRNCWAGDVRTALCLRDADVLLRDPGGFHGNPPNGEYVFSSPCMRPLTFHHLVVNQIQKFADLERAVQDRYKKHKSSDSGIVLPYVTLGDIFNDWHGSNSSMTSSTIEANSDRGGGDFAHEVTESVQACQKMCEIHPRCISFTYAFTECWMKDSIPQAKPRDGTYSGVIPSKFKCNQRTMYPS